MRTSSRIKLPTYHKARLQMVAYKNIQAVVNDVLKPHSLNTSQWVILGLLSESPQGMRATDLAVSLQVELPFITAMTRGLREAELITVTIHQRDKRAKLFFLSSGGQGLVPALEKQLADRLRIFETASTPADITQYFTMLKLFIDNAAAPPISSRSAHPPSII